MIMYLYIYTYIFIFPLNLYNWREVGQKLLASSIKSVGTGQASTLRRAFRISYMEG